MTTSRPPLLWRHACAAALAAALSALCTLPLTVLAAPAVDDDGIDHSWTEERNAQTLRVNDDGSYVVTIEAMEHVLEERGIASLAQMTIGYDKIREDVEIISAWTQKADGRKLKVDADSIRDQQANQNAGATLFQDLRLKVLIFPAVDVGDRVVYNYRVHHKVPVVPGYFQDSTWPDAHLTGPLSLTYDLPRDMTLHADNRGFRGGQPKLQGDRKIWHWVLPPAKPQREESRSVSYDQYGARLWVSTFHDYAQQAQAYERAAAGRAVAGPKLAELAHHLTEDTDEPRTKVYKIAEWVRTNVRYATGDLENTGYEPHSADAVFERLLGDGKDHATLVEAMLKVVGIDSTPALINANNQYQLPQVPMIMHHVINYVPSLDLYLDTVYPAVAQPYLATEEQDKPVLLVHSGKLARTPAGEKTLEKFHADVNVDRDGNASFTEVQTVYGLYAEQAFQAYRDKTEVQRDEDVSRGFHGRGSATTGHLSYERVPEEKSMRSTIHGQISNFVDLPGPFGVVMRSSAWDGMQYILNAYSGETRRTHDFPCYPRVHDEEAHYTLAADIDVLALPTPLDVHGPVVDYRSSYERNGQEVTVTRHFELHHDGVVCKAAEFAAMRSTMDRAKHDLRAQMILQLKASAAESQQAAR